MIAINNIRRRTMNFTGIALKELNAMSNPRESKSDTEQKMFRPNDFAKRHNLAIGGLRHLIFHEKDNGFFRCVRRIGKNVYILEHEFFKWVDEINGINTSEKCENIRK
jgi:hypothetical protein